MRSTTAILRPLGPLAALGAASALFAPVALAQSWGQVTGQVSEQGTDEPVAGATVLIEQTRYGTTADAEGRFSLRLPTGRYRLRISSIGYAAVFDTVVVRRDRATLLNVRLRPADAELAQVDVVAREQGAGVFELAPQDVANLPGPTRSAFQAVRVLPGVAANNEISNQFSVRGGGLSENLLFLNGFEVYLPFRPKQGEQEGLGLLNSDLTSGLTLFTGGFPARYGGKLASALDVTYHAPEAGAPWHGTASASLLDASAAAWGPLGRVGVAAGVRRSQPGRFFGSQATKGRYAPAFTDGQMAVTAPLGRRTRAEAVGALVSNAFTLAPTSRKTYFGYVSQNSQVPSNLQSVYTEFSGEQTSGFTTGFGGLRLTTRFSERLTVTHDVALFTTEETETSNVTGIARLAQVDPGSGGEVALGDFLSVDRADNRVRVTTATGQGRYTLVRGRHALEGGWSVRRLAFDDRIDEASSFTETVAQPGRPPGRIRADSLRDGATLGAWQTAAYVQDALTLTPRRPDRTLLTAGLRVDHFDLNGQLTVSPRLGLRVRTGPFTVFNASAGLYYQPPTYQELRGNPDSSIAASINRDLRAQRSLQGVVGVEHFVASTRLWLRAEAYAKQLDDLISYDVDNVRVRYSGQNDASGLVSGLDLQVRGEFVPGLESWLNYGFLVANETFDARFQTRENAGTRARPSDQRHTVSLFVQDYIPGDRTWKLFLRGLYGSGYPYTPLRTARVAVGDQPYLVPGQRNSARFDAYKRVDIGAAKEVTFTARGQERALLTLTAELLNAFDMQNEVAYNYTSTGKNFVREPIRLTPRTINVRARVTF